jgi:hypothetical protein
VRAGGSDGRPSPGPLMLEHGGPYVTTCDPLSPLVVAIARALVAWARAHQARLELARWEEEGGALAYGREAGSRT